MEIQLNLTHSTYWNAGSAPGISNLAESLLLSYALLLHSSTKKEICIWPFLIWVLTTVGPWLSGLDGINSSFCKGPDNQEPTVTKKIVYNPRLLKFFREVLKILMQCATKGECDLLRYVPSACVSLKVSNYLCTVVITLCACQYILYRKISHVNFCVVWE